MYFIVAGQDVGLCAERSQIQNVTLFCLDYFGDVNNRLSDHLALGDLIRLIAAGTAFIV